MASVVKIKRSAVAGKRPTTSNIETGELALNLADGRLFSSNGSAVFEVGANVHSLTVGSGTFSIANGAMTFPSTDGSAGQYLKTNGSGVLSWSTVVGGGSGEVSNAYLTSTYTTNTVFQAALANTNAYIASISVAAIPEYQANTTSSSEEVIDTFDKTEYRSGKYQIQITNDDGYHACELMVLHNGSAAYLSQYADVVASSYDSLGSFDADISGDSVRIKFTPAASVDATSNVKFKRQLITITEPSFLGVDTDFQTGTGSYDFQTGTGTYDLGGIP